jgi:glutamine cyclotransferase
MPVDKRVAASLVILLGLTIVYTYYSQETQVEPEYTYQIVNKYPHDSEAFTQGLVIHEGIFYEGTGLYGESSLRVVEPETGEIIQSISLEPEYFGEGITIHDNHIYQVTWMQNTGFIYTLDLKLMSNFTISGEGWGLTTDGEYLILSDGTSTISYLDPDTLTTTSTITVSYEDEEVDQINELEYIDGLIYANIWQTNKIAIIEPETGTIVSWIDLTGLEDELDNHDDINVLNGIAYDHQNDKLYVTGKLWPNIFEIKLVPK